MSGSKYTAQRRQLDAALGRKKCDLVIKNVRIFDVFSCDFFEGELAIDNGMIVGVEPGLSGLRTIDAKGQHAVPGFVDAHVHVESSMMLPDAFGSAVLQRGTTTAVCDPHELANVVGPRGLSYFLQAAERSPLNLRVMLSSCVPATHLETNGGGSIEAATLAELAGHPKALGLAEVMNVPAVLAGDEAMLNKLEAFEGRPRDGHAPMLSGAALSAYAGVGITSCHESSSLAEAQEKLSKGMAVWIREGSVAKDLQALSPLLTLATSTSAGFCTDDRNPFDIAEEGHVDYLIRQAIRYGVPANVAFRAASWSVARHYGLDRGTGRLGALAPGYVADIVLLGDVKSCSVSRVFRQGIPSDERVPVAAPPSDLLGTVKASVPLEQDLKGPAGNVHVIHVIPGKIITERSVMPHNARGVCTLAVQERYGHGRKPALGYVTGFGELQGALASSVGHDSHNLIVVGSNAADMRMALGALIESGGGFAVVKDGQLAARLALPHAGLMSSESPDRLHAAIKELQQASRTIGCSLGDPFLQLAFLSLPVIPHLKLTDQGLVDVDRFEFISTRAA